jgi:pimeloyl-ACP methyl ester carboxylesterase
VTIAMDDRLYIATNGVVSQDRPTNWFGWHTGMNPFTNTVPGNNAVVVPYTLRRLVWTLDWLQTRSPYALDPQRTAVMGCSMGGAGTLLLSRYRPERIAAATAFVPQHYTPDTGQRLFGTPAQNLATNELGPNGQPLRVNDFFDAAVRLSPTQRDFCFTRIFRGRRDIVHRPLLGSYFVTGVGCSSSVGVVGVGLRAGSDRVRIGDVAVVEVTNVAGAVGILAVGFAATATPLDGLGAPGCWAYGSADVLTLGPTDSSNAAAIAVAVPPSVSIVGARLELQGASLSAPNALGLATSAALRAQVGAL